MSSLTMLSPRVTGWRTRLFVSAVVRYTIDFRPNHNWNCLIGQSLFSKAPVEPRRMTSPSE